MVQLAATGTFSDGSQLDLTGQVAWTSSDPAVAGGGGPGTASLQPSLTRVIGSVGLTVTNAVVQSIAVTPADPTIGPATQQQSTAMATFSDLSQ
ncbi:MAG: hypothetical protein AB1758_05870 [Candidatus Eremiobacterota bacterium]